MPKWLKMRALAEGTAEIVIFNEIGATEDGTGISAQQFDADLKALGDVTAITLRINSPGGDVFDGVAIYNTLKAHPATITAQIDGVAASAASLIAMAADRIEMPSNAFFLIHEPRICVAMGTADDLAKAAADLEVMNASFVAAYAEHSNLDPDAIKALMAEDRLMSATEALSLGFADEITDAVKVTASYDLKKLPEKARAVVAAALKGKTMKRRATASSANAPRARAADEGNDDKDTLQDLQKQADALAKKIGKKLADMGDGDDSDEENAQASDDDGQSDADTDEPSARAASDDGDGEDGEGDEDVPPPKSKAKAKAARTFATGQEQALAYAQQVTETCALAGYPGKAAAFIKDRKAMAEVRSELLKAAASGKPDTIAGQHRYGGMRGNSAADAEATKGWDGAVAKVNSRAKRGQARRA